MHFCNNNSKKKIILLMLLTDRFYLMHIGQKNNNMKCRLISLKIQRLISIATKIAPESNLFCNQGEIRVVRSLRKTNKTQNYLMWGQISSPFTTNHNGIIKNANQFHCVCLSKRSFVYPPDSDLDASLNAHQNAG